MHVFGQGFFFILFYSYSYYFSHVRRDDRGLGALRSWKYGSGVLYVVLVLVLVLVLVYM